MRNSALRLAPIRSTASAASRGGVDESNVMAARVRDWVAPAAALTAGTIGLLAIVGWDLGQSWPSAWVLGPRMAPSTSIAVTLLAARSLFALRARGSRASRLPDILPILVLILGCASLAQYAVGVDLGIDRLIDPGSSGSPGEEFPGRMSIQTGAALVALAFASLSVDRARPMIAQLLGVGAGLIGLIGLFGYVYGASVFTLLGSPNAISLPACVALMLLAMVALGARVDEGITRLLVDASARGAVARRLLPVMLVVPAGVAWLRLAGERAGLYDAAAGTVLDVIGIGAPLAVTGLWMVSRMPAVNRTRSAAERERDRFFDLSEDLVCTVDAQGGMVFVSSSFERVVGVSASESVGRPFLDFVLDEDRESTRRVFRRQAEGGLGSSTFQNRFGAPGGGYRSFEWTSWPDRETGQVFAAGRNVTERLDAEWEIRTLNAKLEQRVTERTAALEAANRELEAFSYSVSHDLRAPLRSINGFSKILLTDHAAQLDPEAQRLLDVVARNARHMGTLIDDLLAFSRVVRKDVERLSVDMEGLARDAADAIRAAEPDRDIEMSIGPLGSVSGDPVLLGQVWANLLGNAFKFTRPVDGARIEVSAERVGGEVLFTVRDNGVGFDVRYLDKLFKPFSRLHAAAEFEGTGIGLAIVDRIVQRHGGRVWAVSVPGAGATFGFALPGQVRAP